MRYQKLFGIGMVILLLMSSTTLFFVSGERSNDETNSVQQNENTIKQIIPQPMPGDTPHSPIRIDNNAELAAEAVNGSGTAGDPYIIEDWEIDGTGMGYCVYIGNTTNHFEVRNCILHDANGAGNRPWPPYYSNSGIQLHNVTNGVVEGNSFSSNGNGIFLYQSHNNKISKNTVDDCWYGIWLEASDNNEINNNTVTNNNEGFDICWTMNNVLVNNTVTSNDGYGIRLRTCNRYTFINNNTISENGEGVWIDDSRSNPPFYNNNNTLFNNTISYNDVGLRVHPLSNFTTIYHNNFIYNSVHQAYDNGSALYGSSNNDWYNTTLLEGNYWSDYRGIDNNHDEIGDTGYSIDGGTDVDQYPLMKSTRRIDGYIHRKPFRINNNAELVDNASDGTGTYNDPYIIEDYDINGSDYGYCLYIGNTTDHFVLRNCSLHDANGNYNYPYILKCGLNFHNVTNGTLEYNVISLNNNDGVRLFGSSQNHIKNNLIKLNHRVGLRVGLNTSFSRNNTISNNTILWNRYLGARLGVGSINNTIYHNNFIENDIQTSDQSGNNSWNRSYPIGGNYWSDYDGNDTMQGVDQDIPGNDGIGDTNYSIGGGVFDEYPLMNTTVELPTVKSVSPPDGSTDRTSFEPYIISFSETMDTSEYPVINPSPMDGSWAWDSTGRWCNYTSSGGPMWYPGITYEINVTDLTNNDGLPILGDTTFNFTVDGVPPDVYGLTSTPSSYVSINNPTTLKANVTDTNPIIMNGTAIFRDAWSNSTLDNYTILELLQSELDTSVSPNILQADWNATAGYIYSDTAGYLSDGTNQDYLTGTTFTEGSDLKINIAVYFSDSDAPAYDDEEAKLKFGADGALEGISIDHNGTFIDSSSFDGTMSVIPRGEIISLYKSSGELASDLFMPAYGKYGHTYNIPDLDFTMDHLVPSGNHDWGAMAVDAGMNIALNMSDEPVAVDNTEPTVLFSSPSDGATNVSTDAGNYVIRFSEPINVSQATVTSNLPNDTWSWSSNSEWSNGTYNELQGGKEYSIYLQLDIYDYAGNLLVLEDRILEFTTGAPWATVTGPTSTGTTNATPTITYDYDNNVTEVAIYSSSDGGNTWDKWFHDLTVDGEAVPSDGVGWSGNYYWNARAFGLINEPEPSGLDDIEGGEYVIDLDRPSIASSTPDNWDNMINRSADTYVIEFSEEMDTSKGTVDTTLPGVTWQWDDTSRWLNGSYDDLEGTTTYYVNLSGQGFKDLVGNNLSDDSDLEFHTERGPWALGGWAYSDGSYDPRPEVKYSVSDASSVEIYYTDDGGNTWTLWGTDDNANGSWIPDSDLPTHGTYNWNCRAMGYINEPVPDGPDFVESEDYLLLESTETVEIESTIPDDEETSVGLNADTYAIEFTIDMQKKGTPESNLPNVSWSWDSPGRWLEGSYDELKPSTTYYVDLGTGDFQSISGGYLSGNMNRSFITRSEDETATGTVEGQVTDENGEPIEGATVTIPGTDISTTTDENGYYVLEDVPIGEHKVKITHPDYGDQEIDVNVEEGETEDTGTGQLPAKEGGMNDLMFIMVAIIIVVVIVVAIAMFVSKKKQSTETVMEPEEEEMFEKEPLEEDVEDLWGDEPEDTLED